MDESIHTAGGPLAEGIYLLAATVADPAACEPIRDTLRGLLLGKSTRLHWYDQTPRRRRLIAGVLADLDVTHTIIVGAPIDPHRQERARRLCLERLLHELHSLGVERVWAETRTQSLNDRDRTMVAALRSRGAIPAHLAVEFAQPDQEPMLWLPDAVAGAVGMHHRGRDPEPYERLRHTITEHTIRLR
ncbi:hypothetical protein [Leucobacter massiliensis]|uniref:Uncharacterized protein n=1 Tax=Leucobacter massiliensis TaxID=1686285 RepID=A0A2S9QN57_9MICO|nr:hypothetical protein [Leucobacter massiliensis]PRI11010.1 hypothetical protein B4915_09060 [Leucobacter massiliensis]